MARDPDDPRLDERFLRELSHDDSGDVTLVGAVHDHPASVFRAGAIAASRDPAAVALELPPLAVPLFRSLARAGRESAAGEMTAAIAAAPDARHVGIDAFDGRFVRTLLERARADGVSLGTVGSLARESIAFSRTAVRCRMAALLPRPSAVRPGRHGDHEYDCEPTDPPDVQADREREHVDRCLTFAHAVAPPPAIRLRDEAREVCMAERVDDLRQDGDVVAVVGVAHLQPVAERLASA
jgi:pheromone shutdown protein TraB